jgi:hypothetical protein
VTTRDSSNAAIATEDDTTFDVTLDIRSYTLTSLETRARRLMARVPTSFDLRHAAEPYTLGVVTRVGGFASNSPPSEIRPDAGV